MKDHIVKDHPRPDFGRPDWMSLDGEWEFAPDRKGAGAATDWSGREGLPYRIRVPFPVESELSGIGLKRPPENVWYLRYFDLPDEWNGRRIFLKFGAVDYRTRVWLNSTYLGEHEGGYTPFEFEITRCVKPTGNRVAVHVEDRRTIYQVRGKQTFRRKSFSIFYTTVTGIWQPVWIEAAGAARIDAPVIDADPSGRVDIRYKLDGPASGGVLAYEVRDPSGGELSSGAVKLENGSGGRLEFNVSDPEPWRPGAPNLYPLRLRLLDREGGEMDDVRTYFGLRKVEARDGYIRVNGEPFYHRFLLNQGYFPDGIYRPGDPDRWRLDVQDVLDMGFNGVRLHQKIEDPLFLYWCDVLGVLVWGEMPSYLLPKRRCQGTYREQWADAMRRDINHPCIIAWVPFNEQWGIQDVWLNRNRRRFFTEVVEQTRRADPSRPVVSNSGWEHWKTDVLDIHCYAYNLKMFEKVLDEIGTDGGRAFSVRKSLLMGGRNAWPPLIKPLMGPPEKFSGQPIMVSEYGGFGFYPSKNKSLVDNFRDYTLAIARRQHISGFCYTQQYDTEQERNGLLTYDRDPKLDLNEVRKINEEVAGIVGKP